MDTEEIRQLFSAMPMRSKKERTKVMLDAAAEGIAKAAGCTVEEARERSSYKEIASKVARYV